MFWCGCRGLSDSARSTRPEEKAPLAPTFSRVQHVSIWALASSWQVRSKYIRGWTEDRGTADLGGRSVCPAAQARSLSTVRRSSSPKWKEPLDVLGATGLPAVPSKVRAEKPRLLMPLTKPLNNCVCREGKGRGSGSFGFGFSRLKNFTPQISNAPLSRHGRTSLGGKGQAEMPPRFCQP